MICFIKNTSNDCIEIDPGSDLIRQLTRPSTQEVWNNIPVTKAVKDSSIAALSFYNREPPSRHVFYQDPALHVRDHHMDPSREDDGWILGEQFLALSCAISVDERELITLQVCWTLAYNRVERP